MVDATTICLRGVRRIAIPLLAQLSISSEADRGPPRDDLPLPTEPPFTAFVGNLAFDLTEIDLEEFFAGHPVRCLLSQSLDVRLINLDRPNQ